MDTEILSQKWPDAPPSKVRMPKEMKHNTQTEQSAVPGSAKGTKTNNTHTRRMSGNKSDKAGDPRLVKRVGTNTWNPSKLGTVTELLTYLFEL